MESIIKHHGFGIYTISSEGHPTLEYIQENLYGSKVECVIYDEDKTYICTDDGLDPTIWEAMYFESEDRKRMVDKVEDSQYMVFRERLRKLLRRYEEIS